MLSAKTSGNNTMKGRLCQPYADGNRGYCSVVYRLLGRGEFETRPYTARCHKISS